MNREGRVLLRGIGGFVPPEGVPQGKIQQGREGKGLLAILSPGIRGVPPVDNELWIVCLFAVSVETCTFVSGFLFDFMSTAIIFLS